MTLTTSDQTDTSNLPSELAKYDAEYASLLTPVGNEVPDGRYRVRVESIRIDPRKRNTMLMWDLSIQSGQFAGWHIFKNIPVSSKSLMVIKSDLAALGLKLDKFSDLPAHIESLGGRSLIVAKRNKGQYTNIYFFNDTMLRDHTSSADNSIPF